MGLPGSGKTTLAKELAPLLNANRLNEGWEITLDNNELVKSKILINAAGPWINEIVNNVIKVKSFKKKKKKKN